MSTYSEKPICATGIPIIEPTLCPSALVAPAPEDLPLTITMGTTTYNGKLRIDLPERVNRISALILELWKRLNYINFNFSTVFEYTFKYPTAEPLMPPKPDKKVTGSAFDFQVQMLKEIDLKLNSMVLDIANVRAVASIPEHWQIRPEANRPMGVFLFGEWETGSDRIQSPKWQICIPHFIESQMLSFDNSFGYTKGSHQFLYTLSDNSKIIFYGDNPAEMTNVLNRWLSCVEEGAKSGGFLKPGEIKGLPFSIRKLRLVRIDYYAQGILKSTPTSYVRFPRRPIELGAP